MTDDLDIVEFQRRLFLNVDGTAVTSEGLGTILANMKALVDEYGEELVNAMFKELKSLTNDALRVWDERLDSRDQQDKNDE